MMQECAPGDRAMTQKKVRAVSRFLSSQPWCSMWGPCHSSGFVPTSPSVKYKYRSLRVTHEKRARRHCHRMSVCLGDLLKEVTTELVLEDFWGGQGDQIIL